MFVHTPAWRPDVRCFGGKVSRPHLWIQEQRSDLKVIVLQNQFQTNKQTKGKQFNEPSIENWHIESMS